MKNWIKYYSNDETLYVLENHKFKKSTIAFLKHILDYHHIQNTLSDYLSSLSKYKIISMEEIYEFAQR